MDGRFRDKEFEVGRQERLDELSKLEGFDKIVEEEATARGLVKDEVLECCKHIYHEASKHADANDETITIRKMDYTSNELAALVSFMKLQASWSEPLTWKEEEGASVGC